MSNTKHVEMRGVRKSYRFFTLDDLSLDLEPGQIMGFVGPNGAGKSTTIRLLLDLIRPSSGRAAVLGLDSRRDGVEARRRVGYLPGNLCLYDRLTGREQIDSLTRLRGMRDVAYRDELVARFTVPLDRPIRELSKGNRQKLRIVQAFMHRPDLVILDEPTSGLDPLLQEEFRALLRETASDGRAAFLSSHSLDEVQHVADRVAIIRGGRLVDVDAVASLRERALRHVQVTFRTPPDLGEFDALEGVRVEGLDGSVLRLAAPAPSMDAIVKLAAAHEVVDLVATPAELEEIFLDLYREVDDGR